MKRVLAALPLLVLVGCDGGTYDNPTPPYVGNPNERHICIDGFTYFKYSHSATPVFDKTDRLPKRC